MNDPAPAVPQVRAPHKPGEAQTPFGVNEMRLSARQWLGVAVITLLAALLTPRIWEKIERFETGPDYRLPHELSEDYWLYSRHLRQVHHPDPVVVLGDSVVWGEYVLPDGTLSHFLNHEAGESDRFINGGVSGLFPLALDGLIRHYGSALRNKRVILYCNLLWMTSPKADLSTDKEEPFNHVQLVPQFFPRIPCYKAGAQERLAAVVARSSPFLAWVGHLQNAYFEQQSIPRWTLQEEGENPIRYPNAWKNPLAQIHLSLPTPPNDDPLRGPNSPRHKPWSDSGTGAAHFEWVGLDRSLQWSAVRRLLTRLRGWGSDVLVVVGPFNEHMITAENRPAYWKLRDGVAAWLDRERISHLVPPALPSGLYADASHPLTEGYALLARQISSDARFQHWLGPTPPMDLPKQTGAADRQE